MYSNSSHFFGLRCSMMVVPRARGHCSVCDRFFATRSSANRHIKRFHVSKKSEPVDIKTEPLPPLNSLSNPQQSVPPQSSVEALWGPQPPLSQWHELYKLSILYHIPSGVTKAVIIQ